MHQILIHLLTSYTLKAARSRVKRKTKYSFSSNDEWLKKASLHRNHIDVMGNQPVMDTEDNNRVK